MPILDEIGSKIFSAGQKTSKAFSSMSQVSNLKDSISAEKEKIDQYYATMGKVYFERYGAETDEDPFVSICDIVRESHARIECLEEAMMQIQNTKTCPQCNGICDYDSLFCPLCGHAFPREQGAKDMDEIKFCSNCGAKLMEGGGFCSACGQQMTPVAPANKIKTAPAKPPEEPADGLSIDIKAHDIDDADAGDAPKKKRGRPKKEDKAEDQAEDQAEEKDATRNKDDTDRFCIYCGAELIDGSDFCLECGAKFGE